MVGFFYYSHMETLVYFSQNKLSSAKVSKTKLIIKLFQMLWNFYTVARGRSIVRFIK